MSLPVNFNISVCLGLVSIDFFSPHYGSYFHLSMPGNL